MLKKAIPFLLCAMLYVTAAQAQINLGILGGTNFSTMLNTDPARVSVDGQAFSGFGVVLDFGLTKHFSFRTEPSYVTKGATINVSELGLNGQNILEYNYLDAPLLVAYRFVSSTLQPYVMGGVVLSYRVSTEHARLIRPGEVFLVDADPVLKKFDIGPTIGAGISFSLGKPSLFLQGRYTLGLYDIGRIDEADVMDSDGNFLSRESVDAEGMKNRGLLLSIGFSMPIVR